MKGILLAGGLGSRLFPTTKVVSKQLLLLFDKPLIYYPLSTLMLAGVRNLLVISDPDHLGAYRHLLGDGTDFGIQLSYQVQESPRGLADAFLVGEDFIEGESVALGLGDNVFHGIGLRSSLANNKVVVGAKVFGYQVREPWEFGVVEIDCWGKVVSIEEKPSNPRSNYAIPGLYFFDNKVVEFAKKCKPGLRGEIEITSILKQYLDRDELEVEVLSRGVAWLDTGTFDRMFEAAAYVRTIQGRQGLQVCSPHEIAWNLGLIDKVALTEVAGKFDSSPYGLYLEGLMK